MNIKHLITQYEEELDICGAAHYSCLLAKTEMLKTLQKEQREWIEKNTNTINLYEYSGDVITPENILEAFGLDNE